MLTGHIMNAQLIVLHESTWAGLSPEMKAAASKAVGDKFGATGGDLYKDIAAIR